MSIILSILALSVFTVNAGTVTGVVDSVGNAPGTAPIAGVIVTVTPIGGGAAMSDTTLATGDYSIANVPAGIYVLTAIKDGFTPYTAPANVFVTAAGTVTRNIGLTPLPPGITISGTVQDSATANPLVGGKVLLRTRGGVPVTVDSAIVIANGTYSLTHVQAGNYALVVSAAGHTTQTLNVTAAAADLVRNFLLPALPAGIIISGTVKDSVSTNPLVGAKVLLRTTGFGATTIDSAITGAGGTYSIDSVMPGTYSLVASAALHVTKTVTPVTVAAAPITQNFLLAGLPAGIVISGTVNDSATGNPLVGAVVELRSGAGGATLVDSAIVAANGTYALDSVQPGTYRLVARAAGHTTQTVLGVVAAAAPITQNFALVGLPAGITISGMVTDSVRGTALAGAKVYLRNPAGPGGGAIVDSAVVAANGTYALDSVQPGNYNLQATDAGHTSKTVAVTVAATNLARNFQLVALPGGTISGNVIDSTSGAPLAGAVVHVLLGVTQIDSAIVGANGLYTLTNVPAGTYTLMASATGHLNKSVTGVVVTVGVPVTQNFLLVQGIQAVNSVSRNAISLQPEITMHAGILHLRNFSDQGVVSVFNLSGKLIYRTNIRANESAVALPSAIARTSGVYLVNVTQSKMVYRKQVIVQ